MLEEMGHTIGDVNYDGEGTSEEIEEVLYHIKKAMRGYIERTGRLMNSSGMIIAREHLLNAFGQEIGEQIFEFAVKHATDDTDKATYQAMEGLIHNLNTMNSRAGAQVPFSSISYGTDTSIEGRLIIRNVLLATDAGLGTGETPIFPQM